MDHLCNVAIAVDFDTNIALFLNNIKFWTFGNLANKKNIHDGFCWTYNSLEAFREIFPFWTKRQLETIINKAVKAGLLLRGNYNQTKYDRTCWYALSYKAYAYFPDLLNDKFAETLYLSISPKCEIDFTSWRNQVLGIVTPIPDNKPDNKPKNKPPISPQEKKSKVDRSITEEQITLSNPHDIALPLIEEWKSYRKKPLTPRVWDKTNKVLSELKGHGIKPLEAFEQMLEKEWQGIETRYFDKDIEFLKGGAIAKTKKPNGYDHNSTSWAQGIEGEIF